MTKATPVERTSADMVAEQNEHLRELFPEAFSERRVDLEKLRAALGDLVDDRPERYSFTWAGKRNAMRLLQTPSRATLLPCPEQSVNWDSTQHLFIEGDNLEVLKLLYKSYAGRVKMVYIDPPYNTGNDFIYPDNFTDPLDTYLKLTGQSDQAGNLLTSNPETSGRYHSAWLSMMYPRLFVARQLLREDGLIFVSTDDHEIHNLRMLMNELFGEENRIECFIWKKSYGGGAKENYAVTQHEYILLYARNLEHVAELWLPPDPKIESRYYKYRDSKFDIRGPYRLKPLEATKSMDKRENLNFPIPLPWGGEVRPKRQWWWGPKRVFQALAEDELVFTKDGESASVSYKQYLRDKEGRQRGAKPFSIIDGIYTQHGTADLIEFFDGRPIMQFPKPVALMKKLLNMATDVEQGDIILDFFAGSCPLAQSVLQLNLEDGGNRRFIMVQLPEPLVSGETLNDGTILETIADIGKERIRRVIRKHQKAEEGKLKLDGTTEPIDLGFRVFKLAESHYRRWSGTKEREAAELAEQIEIFTDPLLPGWKSLHVIYEVLLKEGYSLTSRIEQQSKEGDPNAVYRVVDDDREQSMLICLDGQLDPETPRSLELRKDDLFICRDVALTDELAANLALQCRLKTI